MKLFKNKLSDEELLIKYKSTLNSDYLGEVYRRYIPLIYGVCLKYLKNTKDAEDAVMQIFENILHKINDYEIKQFKWWIYSVCKNHCLQLIRKDKNIFMVDLKVEIMESGEEMDLFNESDKQNKYLAECMDLLPEPQKVSIDHFFLQGRSYLEVSESTGYNIKSVKSYIQNGKRNLKNCIEKRMEE